MGIARNLILIQGQNGIVKRSKISKKVKESDVLEEVCMMCKKKLTPPTVTIPDTEDGEKGGKVHNMCFIEALMILERTKR